MTCSHMHLISNNLRILITNKTINFIKGDDLSGIGKVSKPNQTIERIEGFSPINMKNSFNNYILDHYFEFAQQMLKKHKNIPIVTFCENNFIRVLTKKAKFKNDIAYAFVNYEQIHSIETIKRNKRKKGEYKTIIHFKDDTSLYAYSTKKTISKNIAEAHIMERAVDSIVNKCNKKTL